MFKELGLLNHNLQNKRRSLIDATILIHPCVLAAPLLLIRYILKKLGLLIRDILKKLGLLIRDIL